MSQRVWDVLSAWRDCLCATLDEAGASVCTCYVAPGDLVSWDYCSSCGGGNCGMAYVTTPSAVPAETFPLGGGVGTSCALPLSYQSRIGVLRCLPVMDATGNPPEPEELSAVAEAMVHDMTLMQEAILCCDVGPFAGPTHLKPRVELDAYVPQTPQGGCTGGEWTVTFGWDTGSG